jgi:outer membrane receptor protein involved in Fe transport
MLRNAGLWAVAAVVVSAPAAAREQRAAIDVPAVRLDRAIGILGRQSGASIGFRDPQLGDRPVRAVRGTMSTGDALRRMLKGTGARARLVAANSYLIEPDTPRRSAAPRKPAAEPSPQTVAPPSAPSADIIVTATKRDIPLGSYPGLIDIIEGYDISKGQGLEGTDAIAAQSASVVSTHLGPGRNKLFIRGIADSSFVGPTQATVGQYWGNSRITYSAPDPSLKLYDLRRIEVLEGPQGTLYGAGSLGGVVRVVPREPQLDRIEGAVWSGVQAVQHGEPGFDGGAIVNLPLVEDRLALRVVGFGARDGGYIDDIARGEDDVNDVTSFGGRAALRYAPDDDLTIDLNLVGQRIDGADSQYAERTSGGLTRSSSIAQPYRNDFVLTDIVARKRWNDLELTSSIGFAAQDVRETFEGPALTDPLDPIQAPVSNAIPAAFTQRNRIEMLTAEVRLARNGPDGTGWLIAASLLSNEARMNRGMEAALFESALTGVENKVQEATVYGEATVQPSERLNVTFGGRLTHSRLSGTSRDAIYELAFRVDPLAAADRTETKFIPSLALAYRASDEITVFARYQEGFRPGGIAVRRDFIQRYASDRVSTWETGARYLGAAFDIEASASLTNWRNIQADLIDGYGFPTTTNVGDGRVLSIGAAATWRPVDRLKLEAAVYLNDSKVTARAPILTMVSDSVEAQAFDRLPNIADTTARLGFDYRIALSDALDLELQGFGHYVGKSILGVGPILGRPQGDYLDTGLEAGIALGAMRFSLSLANLFDARGNRFALGSPFQIRDGDQITPQKPRSVRVGVEFAF